MQRVEIDGVPVLWLDGPAPLTATLIFGCGARDEEFRTIGVTHLIEHLAMSALPRVHYEHNASVDASQTEFYATGRPDQVVDFLATVCRALSDLPLDRIDKEAGVLAAEGGSYTHPTAGEVYTRRHGITGPGLTSYTGPGYDRITADMVAAHARKFFVRGNAVLTLTGQPPEGLRLPLPEGEPPARVSWAPRLPDGPTWSNEIVPVPGMGLVGGRVDAAVSAGFAVLADRLTDIARRDKGLSYDVGGDQVDLGPELAERVIWIDAREGQEAEVTAIMWEAAKELASGGPTRDEVDHEVQGLRENLADPRFVEVDLEEGARAHLFGFPYRSPELVLSRLEAVTPDAVAATMREMLRTAHIVVPDECRVDLTDLDGKPVARAGTGGELPPGRQLRPPALARLLHRDARAARLVLTDTGLAFRDPEGLVHTASFDEVVGVQVEDGSRIVFARGGAVIPVSGELFAGAGPVIAAIDRAVPESLRFAPSELR